MLTYLTIIRFYTYTAIIISSTVVLGLAGNFATKFLPDFHRDVTIFFLIVPSLTITVLTFLLLRSQPRVDVFCAFLMAVLWLTMGAWSVDIIGGVECFGLGSERMPISRGGTMSSQVYCREMKAIEACSWGIFIAFMTTFFVLIALTMRAQALGERQAWARSISELPWFGYDSYNTSVYGYPQYPEGSYVVQQQPGHSVLIQQGQQGRHPSIQQVPGTVVSA